MTEEQMDFCEFWISAHRKVKKTGKPNYLCDKIEVNNRINFDYLEEKLKDYQDKEVIEFLKIWLAT